MAVRTKDINFNAIDFSDGIANKNAKGMTAVYFSDINEDNLDTILMSVNNGILSITKGNKTLNLNNFTGIKYIKTEDLGLTDIITKGLITNLAPTIANKTKLNVTGITNFNDTVDLSDINDLKKKVGKQQVDKISSDKGFTVDSGLGNDTISGSMYSDILKGGMGNDVIYSSTGNDSITGGAGDNKIIYEGQFDIDTINITKKENLTLDLSSYNIESLNDTNKLITNLKGKDLVIIMS